MKTGAVLLGEAHSLEEMASADHVLWLLGAGLRRCWGLGVPSCPGASAWREPGHLQGVQTSPRVSLLPALSSVG